MRKLYVVPIIHTSADLGTLATDIDGIGNSMLGEDFWLRHKEIVAGFWDAIASFFNSLHVVGFKLYQDGLIADGEIGMKIVEQGIKDGSKNYEIIARALERGAKLVMTEDFNLVKKEYDLIKKVVKAKSKAEVVAASVEFKLAAEGLLKDRDAYIAQRIEHTLGDSETGILFVGAYHNVIPLLPNDAVVTEVKETEKVREYHTLLTDPGRNKNRLEDLGKYLISVVDLP